MTFLQPWLLLALPLISVPIIIHLVNQNRHRTIPWAATMFLLQARRMSKGIAKLRYYLILLTRMLAIAGLIFALSRPLSSGWLGLATGNAPETTLILLDRSASMSEHGAGIGQSKRETSLQKIYDLLVQTGRETQLVLLDSATVEPIELDSPQSLLELPEVQATSTAADFPALFQRAAEYISVNQTGRTDVWICSDLRQNDWDPSGGRWETLRNELNNLGGIHFYLLTYPEVAAENLSIRLEGVHRRETLEGAELVMDLHLQRSIPLESPQKIPLILTLNGARSTIEVDMVGDTLVKNGHTVSLSRDSKQGWGRVELPQDANTADNVFEFVYSEPAVQKTIVVSDDPEIGSLLRLAAATPANRNLRYAAEVFTSAQAAAIPWEETALILWQVPLPEPLLAKQLEAFVASGRSVVFFPPEKPNDQEIFKTRWESWQPVAAEKTGMSRWRTDADLLSNTQSGAPLPVGQLEIRQYCRLKTENATPLAHLEIGEPLLVRVASDQGAAYFCSTWPTASHSTLAQNGVVIYVMVQRALARGASVLGTARMLDCGQNQNMEADRWKPLDEASEQVLLSQRPLQAGLYQSDQALLAFNRPAQEDDRRTLSTNTLDEILNGLDYTLINDEAGSTMALASEVWRIFLILMIIALLAEALLCLPDRVKPTATQPAKV